MKIRLICVGKKMPSWIQLGWNEYIKRFSSSVKVELIEIPLKTRHKSINVKKLIDQEGDLMLSKIQPRDINVTLEIKGNTWTTEDLTDKIKKWHMTGSTVNFMVGGPEGLSKKVCTQSNQKWSLSALTLPHPMVRVIWIEQIYRAWSILSNHPYHK